MDLFLDKPVEMEKEAAFASRLSENSENWPQELNSELLKQLPFLSDYEMTVTLDRVDNGRGFAFGYADLANQTERPEAEHDDAGLPHLRVPIIVHERSVKPFSVYMDGDKVMPLTEDRIRESLFNPATFDLSTHQPRDPSLVENFMPPHRSGIGMGGEYKTAGAKTASLLQAIAPTLREKDVTAFIAKVANDPTLQAGFRRSGVGPTLVEVFEKTKRASAEERMLALAEAIEPTVMTFHKLPGGDFLVKSANTDAFNPQEAQGKVVPQEEAAQAMGPENAQAMQPGQTMTVNSEPQEQIEEAPPSPAKPIEEFGQYQVQDPMGNTVLGHVFPEVLSWDGSFSPQPVALFTNGSQYALHDSLLGEMVGKASNLPHDNPTGDGIFYENKNGEAAAMMPCTVHSAFQGPDGMKRFACSDPMGAQFTVIITDGIKAPQRLGDSEYALPESWGFMRLGQQIELTQGDQTGGAELAKQAHAFQGSVELFYNGSYNLKGGCGLEKLSRDFRYDLDPVTAEFMLGVLGVDGPVAKQKVAEARRKGVVKLANLRTITTLGEKFAAKKEKVAGLVAKIPNIRKDLIKEAAGLEDADTVNNLLALNFVNPENIGIFAAYLPELEETSEKLSEMLLFSYLGQQELPEESIERSMRHLEDVRQGLRALSQVEA